tara:strand:- start:352 stop:1461 length:1110 start_codon:yes stop_codon:yes gene_type:complete
MDSTDSNITFDSKGVCDHCSRFFNLHEKTWNQSLEGKNLNKLEKIVKEIRQSGVNNEYDCFLGLSGGCDSSYLLHYIVTELKLKPLVFHVDTGWNSKEAVENIHNLISKLNLELHVKVINWEEMKDLQLAFFKSGLSNIDMPQDHAFMATLYNFAEQHDIKYILNGGNISTEAVSVPLEWMYYQSDVTLLKDIERKFMKFPLSSFPTSSAVNHRINLRFLKGIKVIKALDYIPYIKSEAEEILKEKYNWNSFSNKHYESIFTKFYEGYWLPKRFNFDTRKITYSSMILTGQMTREEALKKISKFPLSEKEINVEFSYIAKKLEITEKELKDFMMMPLKTFKDYKNQNLVYKMGAFGSYLFKQDISGAKR